MSSSVPLPRRSAVPPYRAAERGTLGRNPGTEQRNASGTADLDALADKVLSRVAAERDGGTGGECGSEKRSAPPERTPGTLLDDGMCPHIPSVVRWQAVSVPLRAAVRTLLSRPRWSELASTLFWLARRGWPAVELAGETIEGETAWRRWVSQAGTQELLEVRDRVADGGTDSPVLDHRASRNGGAA